MPYLQKPRPKSKPRPRKFPERRYYSIADGRDFVGLVEIRENCFVAVDCDGEIVGKYTGLVAAARAVSPRRSA